MLRENGIRALQPTRLTTMQRLRKRQRDETPPTEDENDLLPVPTKTVGPIHEDEHVTEAVVICVAGIVDQLNERALAGSKIEKSGTRELPTLPAEETPSTSVALEVRSHSPHRLIVEHPNIRVTRLRESAERALPVTPNSAPHAIIVSSNHDLKTGAGSPAAYIDSKAWTTRCNVPNN